MSKISSSSILDAIIIIIIIIITIITIINTLYSYLNVLCKTMLTGAKQM